ncbi:DUF5133 domain-containing protein [Streptomyces sp. NBC_01478]|uniref:DUF5133 domain-containing protein n=1 Tax=Streptomyces sp. NBC_01478 TaxID=2903882 RepID=UPI002E3380F6|nr:DUF5133 domain-containing protein [Streptomyces sp. NBC_01478]
MPVPDPKAVRKLLTRYAVLRISQAEKHRPQAAAELNDVSHALCVMTGATGIREAIVKADALLAAARGTRPGAVTDGRAVA